MDPEQLLSHENAERIMDEAWKLFQQKGYRGVTMDELCQTCGLTKPTLYYYFHDKENLFVQVLTARLRGFHKVIERPGSLSERLEWIAASILESFQTEYNVLLRDREHIKNPQNYESIRAAFHNELFDPLIALMESGVAQGELEKVDPEWLSLMFMGTINNFIGRSGEAVPDHISLARLLTHYFLYGAGKTG